MNMKKALNNVVLDDKIPKHNWMKEGLYVVIQGDKFLRKRKKEWKKPWILVVHFDMIQMQNNEDEIKSLQRSYSGLWRWKRVLNVVVLDDRIQKHNWMKNGLNVVIKDDRKF